MIFSTLSSSSSSSSSSTKITKPPTSSIVEAYSKDNSDIKNINATTDISEIYVHFEVYQPNAKMLLHMIEFTMVAISLSLIFILLTLAIMLHHQSDEASSIVGNSVVAAGVKIATTKTELEVYKREQNKEHPKSQKPQQQPKQ